MEDDTSTTNMLVKEAINCYIVKLNDRYFYGSSPEEATIDDVLIDGLCDDSRYVNDYLYGDKDWLERKIGGTTYNMVWDGRNVVMSGGDYDSSGALLYGSTKISSLDLSDYPYSHK